ncbi:MAG: DUF4430 domain-containing protein [Mogibacterium sp.]|nr:DUF4430 domain-containing protein [Mogibacterium sp.]
MEKSKTKRWIIIAIIAILVLVGIYFLLGPKGKAGGKTITVKVDHLSKDDATFEITTEEEFLRGALEAEGLISGSESDYGLWVDTVDGEKADDTLQQWWGYTVNGEFAEYGVDQQPVTDGDVYEFTLNEGY